MRKYHRGLILVAPYGELIACKKKTLIIKSRSINTIIGKTLLLLQDKKAYGLIKLGDPTLLDLKQFAATSCQHLVSPGERRAWWPNKRKLYAYPITYWYIFKKPKHVKYPGGPQVLVKPENVKILKG